MSKILTGIIVESKMNETAVVEVTRRTPHPLYKKLLKRSKRFKVDTTGQNVVIGANVQIMETKPVSKDKHFKLAQLNVK